MRGHGGQNILLWQEMITAIARWVSTGAEEFPAPARNRGANQQSEL